MLNAVLGVFASILWIGSYGLFFFRDLLEWWRYRPYRQAMSEMERLEAVRHYAAWVRSMSPPPSRAQVEPAMVPVRVTPPIGGSPVPFPGRRMIGS